MVTVVPLISYKLMSSDLSFHIYFMQVRPVTSLMRPTNVVPLVSLVFLFLYPGQWLDEFVHKTQFSHESQVQTSLSLKRLWFR